MTRQRQRDLCLLLTAAAAFVFAPATPADGQPAIATAWWTRQPAATSPEGGFQVAVAPDGPVSVAALRLPLGARALRLPVADERLGALGAVRLCAASSSWAVVAGGALAAAPSYDCDAGASVLARRDGSAWVAELGPLESAAVSGNGIVVIPAVGQLPGAFQLTFSAPEVDVRPGVTPSSTAEPRAWVSHPSGSAQEPMGVDPGAALSLPPVSGVPQLPPSPLPPTTADAPEAVVAAPLETREDRGVGLPRRLLLASIALSVGLVAGLARGVAIRVAPHAHRSRPPASLQPDGVS